MLLPGSLFTPLCLHTLLSSPLAYTMLNEHENWGANEN